MYKITSVQDASRPRCKRFVAHIDVDTEDRDLIKTAILSATAKIRSSDEYSSELTKQRLSGPAHVVRLYVHLDGKLICQSMWMDKTADVPLPKPLNYNDFNDDIGIAW